MPQPETWFDPDMIDTDIATDRVQRLLEAARGVSLILESLSERDVIEDVNILSGLASALRLAVEECDLAYFRSAGDIARSLDPKVITALLKRKIEQIGDNQ